MSSGHWSENLYEYYGVDSEYFRRNRLDNITRSRRKESTTSESDRERLRRMRLSTRSKDFYNDEFN